MILTIVILPFCSFIVKRSNKTIAKNTSYLYLRMMFTMIISLYTSRVVLNVLGLDDFGLYQVVGGIVSMLSFVNGALSSGSSRFLTVELGKGDLDKLNETFSTTLLIHVFIAIVVLCLAETIGLWFVLNKLSIPEGRELAVFWVYQFSVLTTLFTITQIPYTATIISHENMGVYAYLSIIDVCSKLLVVYLLRLIRDSDTLVLYSALLCFTQIGLLLFIRYYCVRKYDEARFKRVFNKKIVKSVLSFSGWNLFTEVSLLLSNQGMILLTNMFFGPSIVASRTIAIQVNMAANSFVNNFRTAVNPQIVKLYATGNYSESRKLLLDSSKMSFYLLYLLAVPIVLLTKPLINLWLGQVPDFSVVFLQIAIVESMFNVFNVSFHTALYTKGQLKENALVNSVLGLLRFFCVWFLFYYGASPVALSYVSLISYILLGLLIKPILIYSIAGYSYKSILSVFYVCVKIVILSLPIILFINNILVNYINNNILFLVFTILYCCTINLVVIYFFGLDVSYRRKINEWIINVLNK